jgi:hypothetical protein
MVGARTDACMWVIISVWFRLSLHVPRMLCICHKIPVIQIKQKNSKMYKNRNSPWMLLCAVSHDDRVSAVQGSGVGCSQNITHINICVWCLCHFPEHIVHFFRSEKVIHVNGVWLNWVWHPSRHHLDSNSSECLALVHTIPRILSSGPHHSQNDNLC